MDSGEVRSDGEDDRGGRGSVTMYHAHHDKRRSVRGRPPKHNNQIRPTDERGGGQFRHEGADVRRPQGRIRETKRLMMMKRKLVVDQETVATDSLIQVA